MNRLITAALLSAFATTNAAADCGGLDGAVSQPDAMSATWLAVLPQHLPERVTPSCEDGGGPGLGHASCHWGFALRDPIARQTYDQLLAALTMCAGPEARIEPDSGVNHPDTYDAVNLWLPHLRIYLAYKDKSGLDQTFVTLRFFGPG